MIVPKPRFKKALFPLLLCFVAAPQVAMAQQTSEQPEQTSEQPGQASEQLEAAKTSPASNAKKAQLFGGRRWAVGIIGGYYAPTGDIYDLQVDPLGPTVGLAASWTMQNGVWFGIQGQYFPGSTVSQTYRVPFSTTELAVDADTQLTSFGASVGYDRAVGPLVVRFALEVGASLVTWDLGDVPYSALSGYSPMQGSGVTPYLAPGMGVVIPFGGFFLAPEFRYRLELGGHAPSAMGGQLHTGWRF